MMVGLRLGFGATVLTRKIARASDFPNDDEGRVVEIDNGAHDECFPVIPGVSIRAYVGLEQAGTSASFSSKNCATVVAR